MMMPPPQGSMPPPGGFSYRDRAAERRKKFGISPAPSWSEKQQQQQRMRGNEPAGFEPPAGGGGFGGHDDVVERRQIDSSNIGNRMLQKMGWKEGLGLGKANQGRTGIIEVCTRQLHQVPTNQIVVVVSLLSQW